MQTQAPNYESLIEILSEAGQDERLILLTEGLMHRQIAVDGNEASTSALQQSSLMWQNLYQSLQSGVVFVKRRQSVPNFNQQPSQSGRTTPKNSSDRKSTRLNSSHSQQSRMPSSA